MAERKDPSTGVREIVGFFGDTHRLFGCTYLPAEDTTAGVVICGPLLAELQTAYRREVLIARALAECGLAVQRFHYRGSGNSEGAAEDCTFDTLTEDALAAILRFQELSAVSNLGFVGTRFGGFVAAAAGRHHRGSPIAIVSPVFDSRTYFAEILRSYLFGRVKEAAPPWQQARDPVTELRTSGWLDVLGYPLGLQLYETSIGRSLLSEVDGVFHPLLLIPVGKESVTVQRDFRVLMDWEGIDIRPVDGREAWWFGGGAFLRDGEADTSDAIVRTIADWIPERLRIGGH